MKTTVASIILIAMIVVSGISGCASSQQQSKTPTQPTLPISSISDSVTPTIPPIRPPDTSTWLSPGKVIIGNFHEGARAEYPLTLHNKIGAQATFSVEVKVANYTTDNHMKAPIDILQDWVMIADTTPTFASGETKDIMIALEMPANISEQQTTFWELTQVGSNRLVELKDKAIAAVKLRAEQTITEKYKNRPQDILPEMINELITPKAIEEEFRTYPESNLLVYLASKSSVSWKGIETETKYDIAQVQSFEQSGYIARGNLTQGKWEFWIIVHDTSESGMVQTEIASRWMISMRA